MQHTLKTAGFSKQVIGVSGGVDSAVSAALAVDAMGKENIYPVLLPYGKNSSEAVEDAKLVIKALKIPKENVSIIDIQEAVDVIVKEESELRTGNIMARVRMIYLFDLAKKLSALVCGTENRTEHYLGYFTRFGDGASDVEPILGLYKTQVWDMAKHLKLPSKIIKKTPTAGLWHGQTDEGELGFSYKDADTVLYYYVDKNLSLEEIIKKGIDEKIVIKVLERVKQNEFKHTLPHIYS